MTKQTFEPVVASSWFEPSNETYNIWVASDAWEPTKGAVTATWYNWNGKKLSTKRYEFSLDPLDSTEIASISGWDNILPSKGSIKDSVLLLHVEACELSSCKKYRSENY
jgi:beta-mannosidase